MTIHFSQYVNVRLICLVLVQIATIGLAAQESVTGVALGGIL